MSVEPKAKVRLGTAEWTVSPDHVGQRVGLPAQPTRQQFPLELCRDPVDADRFIGSKGFNFLADVLAQGELVSFTGAKKAGEVFAIEDVTGALMNETVRAALAAEVSKRSGGKTSLRAATEDEIRREPLKAQLHLAIERDGKSSPFGVHETGLEPHIVKG